MKHHLPHTWIPETFRRAAWAPVALVLAYAVGVKATNVQSVAPWIDMPAHFLGGAAICYFFAVALFNAQVTREPNSRLVNAIAALGLTSIAAIVWELIEYAADLMLGTRINLGVADTLADLALGLLGGITFLVASTRSQG